MPLLDGIQKDFEKTQPFKGLKVALSVHLEAKTPHLCEVMAAGLSDVKVYFESNSWSVLSQYEPELQKVASFLKENADYTVILTAYCDSRYGTAEYNKLLSERRANAVAKFLKKEGVDSSQILIRPAGGIDTYSKGENVKKNRFVVCEIVK